MGFFTPKFEDLTMKTEHMTTHIRLAYFGGRFGRAQRWLNTEIMHKMEPVIPYKTGKFLSRIQQNNRGFENTGSIRVAVPPQGKYLYPGVNFRTGKPFKWTNPKTQPRWGSWVIRTYKPELLKGVKDILLGRK